MSHTAIQWVGLGLAGVLIGLWPFRAVALDGFVVTVHSQSTSGDQNVVPLRESGRRPSPAGVAATQPAIRGPWAGQPSGNLVRYDLKNDQVVRTTTLYDKGDAVAAAVAPRGDRVAFVKQDGTIAVAPAAGGPTRDLCVAPAADCLQWPAAEGERWIYYVAPDPRGLLRHLRRVNVANGRSEFVVAFDGTPDTFTLARDATPTSGHLVARLNEWPGVVGYDLTAGTGDLYERLLDEGAWAPTLSLDGALYADLTRDATALRVADWNGRPRKLIRLAGGAGDVFASPRWAVNAGEWIVAGMAKRPPAAPAALYSLDAVVYDWARAKPVRVTQNPGGTFDRPEALWVADCTDFGLGNFEGEAPFTVTLARDGMHGGWEWDFGDGKSDRSSATGQHTYADPGTFTVKARKGDGTLEGTVNVLDRAAPHVTGAWMIGDRQALLQFDEAVRAENASVAAAVPPGVVRGWSLDANGRSAVVSFAEPPAQPVALSLEGFVDCAQAPNPLAERRVTVERPDWPSSRAVEFLWESSAAPNVTFADRRGEPVSHRLLREGQAKFDRFGAMLLTGGSFRATAESVVYAGAHGFAVEATIRPHSLAQGGNNGAGPAAIVSLIAENVGPTFTLAQTDNRLVCRVRTRDGDGPDEVVSPPLAVCTLPDAGPHHVVISYAPGRLACFLDGRPAGETAEARGDALVGGLVRVGRTDPAGAPWHGSVEGVAVYARPMPPDEARQNFDAYRRRLDARPKVPRLEVEAKLTATSTVPTFASVAPYREALVVYEYEIVRTLKGEHDGKKLRVAHFGLVNAQPTEVAKARVGATTRLVLEKYTDRPDLKETLLSDTLPEDFDAVLYVEAE